MNKKALITLLAIGVVLVIAIVAYVTYSANKSESENNNTSKNNSEEISNTETTESNDDEDAKNSETDEEPTENNVKNEVSNDTSTSKEEIDVSNAVESRTLSISFVLPSAWYWAGRDNGMIAFSNKANAEEINLENKPTDYQSFFLARDNGEIAKMLSDETVTKQIETYDGAKVKLYKLENEEGIGPRMYALWTSSDGADYYGVTGGPSSTENVEAEISKMQEVILTIQHL